jgi:hypothetical protein
LIEEYGASGYDNYSIGLTEAEQKYYKIMRESGEFSFVGAGLGGGFTNTSELHIMKYKEAMAHLRVQTCLEKGCAEGRQDLNVDLGYEKEGKLEHIVPG